MTPDPAVSGNGLTAAQLFSGGQGLTFDDIVMPPPFASAPTKITLTTLLARDFEVRLPIVSSPMDTVTEWQTAMHMALHGGIGIIHMNLSTEDAAAQVRRVKRAQMGIVTDPLCGRPSDPVSLIDDIKARHGFSTILVTENGESSGRLLGMVTKGHAALAERRDAPLCDVMIPLDLLVTCRAPDVPSLREARRVLRDHPHANKIPLVTEDGRVAGLVTREDVVKAKAAQYKDALRDENEQLRVGAAVSTHERDDDRVVQLLEVGADVLVVDSAQGATKHAVRRIRQIREQSPNIPIIAGNVVRADAAQPLIDAGATGLRVGMGSGSICTTQQVLGLGRAQLSAVYEVARYASTRGVPVISDGGIREDGDIVKALACGASAVMVGRLIAGCDETPGEPVRHQDRLFKQYRGMGSPSAIRAGGQFRYGDDRLSGPVVAQGVEALVPAQGSLDRFLPELAATLGKALEYCGCGSIEELHRKMRSGEVLFELRSNAARQEGRPHDILVSTMRDAVV